MPAERYAARAAIVDQWFELRLLATADSCLAGRNVARPDFPGQRRCRRVMLAALVVGLAGIGSPLTAMIPQPPP